ncbi:unnamed protein product, partial [Polarella glacialis]
NLPFGSKIHPWVSSEALRFVFVLALKRKVSKGKDSLRSADSDTSPPTYKNMSDTSSQDLELLNMEEASDMKKDRFQAQISNESDATTAASEEEFVQQCTEIDALTTKVVAESSIKQAFCAALTDGQFCVSIADPRTPDNALIAVSNQFLAMTGYGQTEVLGKSSRFLSDGCAMDPE